MNKKILVVEDDIKLNFILSEALKQEGFSVLSARDGQEGLNILKKEKINLIVLDILMPKMNGIEMVRAMKKESLKVPIIFLSNLSNIESISDAENEIAADYFLKSDTPIDKIIEIVKKKISN